MTIAKFEVERFSLTTSKSFDAVVAALKSAIGQPDIVEFFKATEAANSFPDLERVVQGALGRTGLMLFAEFDLGGILRRESGSKTPKIVRLVVGNPLIMKEMAKHVPDAGSYAPVTILVDERADGVHVSYDKMEICCLMAVRTPSPSPAISTRRSPPCCRNARDSTTLPGRRARASRRSRSLPLRAAIVGCRRIGGGLLRLRQSAKA